MHFFLQKHKRSEMKKIIKRRINTYFFQKLKFLKAINHNKIGKNFTTKEPSIFSSPKIPLTLLLDIS